LKLKRHILPRIQAVLAVETGPPSTGLPPDTPDATGTELTQSDLDSLYFKNNRLYRHNILRINYTTYDVRRAQDIINPKTDRRDVMLLAPDTSVHQYRYARVLGIYHVNVIYTGRGMLDYRARRMEFLYVRWFEPVDALPVEDGWNIRQLDRLRFPAMDHPDAFGFVNPDHVLRAFHAIPRFLTGPRHPDGKAVSFYARDAKDWNMYYANR
jgi:hypothetical protein